MALNNSICVLIIIGLLVLTNTAEAGFLCNFVVYGLTAGVSSLTGIPGLAPTATGMVSKYVDEICG